MQPRQRLALLALHVGLVQTLLLEPYDQADPEQPGSIVHDRPVKVLVFGDSWGALGPGWQMLRDMFVRHHVNAIVKSTAVSGTLACQWSFNRNNLAVAARQNFGEEGPHFVWFTLGGNDLLSPLHQACAHHASNMAAAMLCVMNNAIQARRCNKELLEPMFEKFPAVQVVQCGYDFQCAGGLCLPFTRWAFCVTNVTCANVLGKAWGNELLKPLVKHFGTDKYMAISIDGASQVAGDMEGAEIGDPIMDKGSPCELMLGCEHPAPGTRAAFMVGEGFWNLYFRERLRRKKIGSIMPTDFPPVDGWEDQFESDVEDVLCNLEWMPDLESSQFESPPCNRSAPLYAPFVPEPLKQPQDQAAQYQAAQYQAGYEAAQMRAAGFQG